MESLDAPAGFMDDLLDFALDIAEEEEEDDDHDHDNSETLPFPFPPLPKTSGLVEEELEWISNKDAFPMVESFVDFIPNHPPSSSSNRRSPVSVLESSTSSFSSNGSNKTTATTTILSFSSSLKVPVRARSKRRKRRREVFREQQWQCWAKMTQNQKSRKQSKPSSTLGRKCLHCHAEKTPQWRAGPMGPKTLCNACGVRYKSGRLVPEYRPASSPTFSSELHSNSHRKIIEMRRQKQMVRVVVGSRDMEMR